MKTKLSKLFTALALALGFATAATAATPVAVWDGDFGTTTKGDFTLDANDNTVADDGSIITIGSDKKGVLIDWNAAATTTAGFANKKYTVLVRYANLQDASNIQLLSTFFGGTTGEETTAAYLDRIGFLADQKSVSPTHKSYGVWTAALRNTGQTRNSVPCETSETTKYMAVTYDASYAGYAAYFKTTTDGAFSAVYTDKDLKAGSENVYGVAIGGPRSVQTWPAATGMKIQAIAIFNSVLTTAEMAAYKWPSEYVTITDARWGNIGDAVNGGCATEANQMSAATTFTVSFADTANICTRQIGANGTLSLKKVRLVSRNDSRNATMSITVTQGTVTGTTTDKAEVDSGIIYQSDRTAKDTQKYWDFTFATPLEIDTTESFTLYINGGARCIKVANPTMKYDATWSPAVEFIGDYTFVGSKPKFFLNYYHNNTSGVDGWLNYTQSSKMSAALPAQTTNGISFTVHDAGNSTNYRFDICTAGTVDFNFAGTYTDIYGNDHSSLYEEMKTSLSTTLPVNDTIFKTGVVNGGTSGGTATVSDLDAAKTYVMYFGFGVCRDTYNVIGFKLDSSNCGAISSLDYVVSKSQTSSDYPTTAASTYTSFSAGQSICFGADSSARGMMLVRAILKPKSDGTVKISLPGARSGISFVAIAEMAALDNMYTATVAEDSDFSELEWSPEKPTGGFKSNAILTINNTAAATVTFDEDVTVSKIKVVNDSGKALGMTFDSSKAVSAKWDFSDAAGGISFASLDGTELAKNAVAGAPYSYWAISGTVTGSPTVTGPTMPTGYSVASEVVDGYGLRLIVTAPDAAQFGSININFAGGRSSQATVDTSKVGSLTTAIGGYPVVGTSWNDLAAANQTATSVPKYIKSDGTLVTDASITLTATGVNNPYTSGAANNMLITGYMDDSGNPVVTINNIPFAKYRVILYRATDTGSTTFSAAQIGTTSSDKKIYYGPTSSDTTGGKTLIGSAETVWGKSDYRTSYIEGVNYIVSDVLEGTAGSATAYIYSHKHSGRAGVAAIQIVEVGQYVAMDFAATVTEDENFSALDWSPAKPAAGFPEGANFTLTNSSAADTTTVTIDSTITAGKLTIVSATKELKLANFGANMTVTSCDFSQAAGGVGLDVTSGWTASETIRNYFRDNDRKIKFYGSGQNGVTIDYGTSSYDNNTVKGHFVFDGGVHTFQKSSESAGLLFGANATAENPTLWVKDNTTLNFKERNPCGWNTSGSTAGIIRMGNGATVSAQNSASGTWYWSQRFYFDPGSTLDIVTTSFRVVGSDEQANAQFYMPASDGGTATISSASSSTYLHIGDNGYSKMAFDVGAGSTLEVTAPMKTLSDSRSFKKYGTGTLKLSGSLADFKPAMTIAGGVLELATTTDFKSGTTASVSAGATLKFGAANSTFANVISGDGAVVKNGEGTTTILSGANTYTGTTTVEAGTLKVAESATLGTGNYTVNSGATLDLGTHRPSTAKLATSAGTVCVTLTDDEQTKFDDMEQFEILNTVDDATLGALRVFDADGNEHASTVEVAGGKVKVTKLDEKTQPFNVTASGEKNWTAAGWTDSSDPVKDVISTDWDLKVGANLEVAAETSATLTLDRAIQLGHFNVTNDGTLAIAATGDNTLTIEALAIKNTGTLTIGDDAVSASAIDDSESTGATTLNFAPGTANITAGTNTVVKGGGTGTLTIGANKTATINDGVWAGTVAFDGLTSTLRYAGTTELASVPYTSGNDGTIVYAAPFAEQTGDGVQFAGAMTRKFEDGFSVTATRFVTGNNAGITQNFTQDGGSITVTGDTQAGENTSSILMAHWNSTVNYALKGGSLTAENAAIQFGLDGKIYMTVGGGDGTATLRAKGIWQKSRASASTLTLKNNGVIELGSDGLQFTKTNPSLTLEGGTIKAYADTSIAVAHADGMKVTGATTIDLNGNDVTVSAVITDSGSITVNDSSADADGTLTLTGANTYTGTMTVEAGTLKVDGNFSGSYAIGANGAAEFTVDTTVDDYDTPTVTTLDGTVKITAKTTTQAVMSGATLEIATLPKDATSDKVQATLIDKESGSTIATDTTIDPTTGKVTVKLHIDDFTLTPSASGAFTWAVGDTGSTFDGDAKYTEFGRVAFNTTANTTAVTLPSLINSSGITLGGTYGFTGSPLVASYLKTVEGAAAAFTNNVVATDVAITNGAVAFASLTADDVTVSNTTFEAAVVGPMMKYVRLTIKATSGNTAPAVGEFRLYRANATSSATKTYSILDWPKGTKVTESYGDPATVNMTVTKENSGYPCAVGTSNESQPGCLIDGYYGNSGTATPYGKPSGYSTCAYNKWWMNGKSSPWTVTIEFPYPVATFSGCNFCLADYEPRNPTAWMIEVSSDGENWTTVNTETGATWDAQYAWKGGDENVPAFLNASTTPTDVEVQDKTTVVADGIWTAALNVSGNVTFKGVAGKSLTLDEGSSSTFAADAKLTFDLNDYDISAAGKQYVIMGSATDWPDTEDITVIPSTFKLHKDTQGYYVLVTSGNYWLGADDTGAGTWDLNNTVAWGTNMADTVRSIWLNGPAAFFTRNAAVTIADADITPTAINITSNDDIAVSFAGVATKLAGVPVNIGSTNVTLTVENADAMTLGTVTAVADSAPKFVKAGAGELTLGSVAFTNITANAGTLKFSTAPSAETCVTVANDGTVFDLNGKGGSKFVMTLAGGKLANNGSKVDNITTIRSIALTANSKVGGSGQFTVQYMTYQPNTIDLGSYTLTKEDANQVLLVNTTISGTGMVDVQGGTLYGSENTTFGDDVTLKIGANGTLFNRSGKTLTVAKLISEGGTFTNNGTITGLADVTGVDFTAIDGTVTFGTAVTLNGAVKASANKFGSANVTMAAASTLDVSVSGDVPSTIVLTTGSFTLPADTALTDCIKINGAFVSSDWKLIGGTLFDNTKISFLEANAADAVTLSDATGLSNTNCNWVNASDSTATLTLTADASIAFEAGMTASSFKVVSAEGKVFTITGTSFANATITTLDFSSAAGGVKIDCTGITAETVLYTGTVSGIDNVEGINLESGFALYVTATEISVRSNKSATYANPVTGENGTFGYAFFGSTDGDWAKVANWRTRGSDMWIPLSGSQVPGMPGGIFQNMVLDGDLAANKTVSVDTLEGWNLWLAVMNGVNATVATCKRFQTDYDNPVPMWIWVDADSSLKFTNEFSQNNGNYMMSYYVAAKDGITFESVFAKNGDTNYRYFGDGSVKYAAGVSAGTHTMMGGNITLGGDFSGGTISVQSNGTITATSSAFTISAPITVAEGKTLTLTNTADDAALTLSGALSGDGKIVIDDSITTVILGAGRSYPLYFESADTVVQVTEVGTDDGVLSVTLAAGSQTPTYRVLGLDGTVRTVTDGKYTPSISGVAAEYDFTFTNTLKSVGNNKAALTRDTSYGLWNETNCFNEAGTALFTAADVYMSPSYPTEWSASVFAQMPNVENAVLMAFGTKDGGAIALIKGAGENDVILARTTGNSAYATLTTMTVPNATTASHLYTFCKSDKQIKIYLDATLWTTYTSDTSISFGSGFQMGSLHGGIGSTKFKQYGRDYWDAEDETKNSTVTILRIFKRVIGPNTVKALSDAYPYQSPYGTFTRDITEDAAWVATDAWSKEGVETKYAQPDSNASVKLNNTGTAAATVKFNLADNATYEGLTLSGDYAITIASNDEAPKGGKISVSGLVTIGCDVTNDYAAIDISGSPVSVSDGKTLTIDFTSIDLSTYYEGATIDVTGQPNLGTGATIEAVLPTAVAGRTATFAQDPVTGYYKLTIAMTGAITGTVNQTGKWGDTGVITWKAGDVEIAEPDWTKYTAPATLVVEGENSYTLTYPSTTVAGTIAKAGTGTLAIASGNNGKTYTVDAGTLKFTQMADNGAATITINAGGTFDLNGKSGGDPNLAIVLNGGTLVNEGTDMGVGQRQFSSITLTADSTIGGTKSMYFVSNAYAANTLELGGHTLSKTGCGTFGLCNTTVNNGTFAIEEGTLDFARNASTFNDNAMLIVADAATLQTSITQGNPACQTFGGTMSRWSSVTGAVVVADGTLQLGSNTSGHKGEYKFGKSIAVSSGKTLKLWLWTTRDQNFNRDTKAVLTTPVTLNGGNIYTQDGAYWFDAITVNGASTMTFKYNKSHGIGTLNGDENATLTLTRESSEGYLQYFAVNGGDFNGTFIVNNTDTSSGADFWLSPMGTVLADATIQCQGTGRPTYIVLRDNATLGAVTGDKFDGIFGDGAVARTVTLTKGTYAATIKDVATGTSGDYPLSVVIDGDVKLIGSNTYTGTTTINDGATLDAQLGVGLPSASEITIAEGGKLVVDLENFATVTETKEAYNFSGDLPANALDIRNQAKYPWITIGTEGENLGKVIINQAELPFKGLHIVKMLPKHTSKTADRDPNGRDSGWIDLINYGPTETNLANYKIVRSNIGKAPKTADSKLDRLCSYTLQKGDTIRVYTSEEYDTAEDYGGTGTNVAWFATIGNEVKKLDAYQDGAIMVIPTKVNPKKFPMVRLYDFSTNKKGVVVDEVIVPCDLDDNMMVEVVANTNKLERYVVYANGEKVEYGPEVNSMYGIADVTNDLVLLKPTGFAPANADYPLTLPVNPFMTNGTALESNKIETVKIEYRVFDPTTITVTGEAETTSHTATTDAEVTTYGEGCTLWAGNIPASAMQKGKLVQFRAKITDKGGKTWTYPRNLNPDIGYEWYGVVVQPDMADTPDATSTSVCTNKLQTFMMFIDDTNAAQMDLDIDDPSMTLTYGSRCAIYDASTHTYYDNVRIDLRGQTSKSFYKKSHGLRFSKVAPLTATDPFTGETYETRKTSFIAEYGDPMYLRQTLALRIMRESGVKAPFDWPVRVYKNGTFYQLAFHSSRFSDEAVEDFYDLSKYGYSYKNVGQLTTNCGGEKKTPDDDNESDLIVLHQYTARMDSSDNTVLTKVAMTNFNLAAWINYFAAVKVTQEADDVWTNLGIYINKYDGFFNRYGDDTIMPLAYDQNLSFGQWYYADDDKRGRSGIVATNDLMKSHPFYGGKEILYHFAGGGTQSNYNRGMETILQNATYREAIARRIRTLAEKYLGAQDATKAETPIWNWVVAYTNAIADDVEVDHTRWDYTSKVISTASNIWVWETALEFGPAIDDLWENYIVPRRKHFYDTHAAKNAGKEGYPTAVGYATGASAGIPETQAATETFGKHGALYFTDVNGERPGEAGFDLTVEGGIIGICNTNAVAIDVSDWTIEGAVVATLKPGTVIPANGTLWIVENRVAGSQAILAKGTEKPMIVGLDTGLLTKKGKRIEYFDTDANTIQLKDAKKKAAISYEAEIGTKYYITLGDAFNGAAADDIVTLLTDIDSPAAVAVGTSVYLYGDTNTLSGAGFDVAGGTTLTVASGRIANGALENAGEGSIALIGGKYTDASKTAYEDIVADAYHMATIGLPDDSTYLYQVVPGEAPAEPSAEIVLPVAQIEGTGAEAVTNDTGVLAFTTNWLVTAGLAEVTDFESTEGKKKVVDNLNAKQDNNIQVWENKVLGLDGSKETEIPVIQPKQTADAENITFKLDNVKVDDSSGAIVTYKVWSGDKPGEKGKASDEVLHSAETAVALPKSGVKYYTIEVITTPAK